VRYLSGRDDLPKGKLRGLLPIVDYLRPYRGRIIAVFAALIITSGAVLGLGAGLRHLVDSGISAKDADFLDNALSVMLGVIVVLAAATWARFYLVTMIGENIVADLRRDLYNHLVSLAPGFYETNKTGELISRITTDTTVLQVVIGGSLSMALRNVLILIGGLAMLLITSAELTGYIIIIIPLIMIPIMLLGKRVRALSRTAQDKVAGLASHIEESLTGIKTVQSCNQEVHEKSLFADKVNDALIAALARVKMRAWLTALVIIIAFGSVGIVLWLGGHYVLAEKITAGQLSSFLFYSVLVANAFGSISSVTGELYRAAGAAERLIELLNTPSLVTDPQSPQPLPSMPNNKKEAQVSFDSVTFHYPARPDHPAIKDISFNVFPGQTVALVGPSGAGKSTILQLLQRFYDPKEGHVCINSQDIRTASLADLRSHFAYVPQEPMIFSESAYSNIAYGDPTASREDVISAAKAARAWDFIQHLPDGLDTFLGEKGVRLSGGERQRIAIARAILKDPQILLLDEATSALDSENERMVQDALESLMANRTTVVIAHRLSTIAGSDAIILFEQGKIQAIDTHKNLLKTSKLYQRLAKGQFS